MNSANEICDEVLSTIRMIIREVDTYSKRLMVKSGVTGPQLVILKHIYRNKHITTTALAEDVSLSQSTATSILDRLVDRNLVKRIRDTEDKRKWLLELTKAGIKTVESTPSLARDGFFEDFSTLPKWQQTQILGSLQRVASMLQEES